MNNARNKYLGFAILIITTLGLVYYALTNWTDFKNLQVVEPTYIFPLIAIMVILLFIIGLITAELMQPLGLSIEIWEAFLISALTSFYNLVLPFRGGMATRAVYLKARHNFSYGDFIATLSASYILTYLIGSFLGLCSLILINTSNGFPKTILIFSYLGIFIMLTIVILFSPTISETKYSWINKFIRVINNWGLIKNNKKIILITSLLSLIQLLLEAISLYFEYKFFGMDIPIIKCLFLVTVSSLGLLIQITPAGLGVNEALLAFSSQVIMVTPAQTLAATFLGRLVAFLVLIVLGPLSSFLLINKIATKNKE